MNSSERWTVHVAKAADLVVSLTGFSSAPTLPLDAGGRVPRRVVSARADGVDGDVGRRQFLGERRRAPDDPDEVHTEEA